MKIPDLEESQNSLSEAKELNPGPWVHVSIYVVQAAEAQVEDSDYDRLIQLDDALTLPTGFGFIEKRLIEVAFRRGVDNQTLSRWKSYFDNQHEFERISGKSIYNILHGVQRGRQRTLNRSNGQKRMRAWLMLCRLRLGLVNNAIVPQAPAQHGVLRNSPNFSGNLSGGALIGLAANRRPTTSDTNSSPAAQSVRWCVP